MRVKVNNDCARNSKPFATYHTNCPEYQSKHNLPPETIVMNTEYYFHCSNNSSFELCLQEAGRERFMSWLVSAGRGPVKRATLPASLLSRTSSFWWALATTCLCRAVLLRFHSLSLSNFDPQKLLSPRHLPVTCRLAFICGTTDRSPSRDPGLCIKQKFIHSFVRWGLESWEIWC